MKWLGILCLTILLASCGAAVGDSGEGRRDLQIEVNEALAISHLKSLVGAQTQAQSLQIIDADNDGIGEYCFILELAGGRKLREPGKGLKLPLLGSDFKEVARSGFVDVHGYLYLDFLPGEGGTALPGGPIPGKIPVSVEHAESSWACYAWPVGYGTTGRRSFFVTSEGVIHSTDTKDLSGRKAPSFGTALVDGEGFERPVRPEWKKVK